MIDVSQLASSVRCLFLWYRYSLLASRIVPVSLLGSSQRITCACARSSLRLRGDSDLCLLLCVSVKVQPTYVSKIFQLLSLF